MEKTGLTQDIHFKLPFLRRHVAGMFGMAARELLLQDNAGHLTLSCKQL